MGAGPETPARVGKGARRLRTLSRLLLVPLLLSGTVVAIHATLSTGPPPAWQESSVSQPAQATAGWPPSHPLRGALPFVTVLCKFPDVPGEPWPRAFFERLLGDAYPGLDHYWRIVSYGAISLAGSTVMGWYTMPHDGTAYRTPPSGAPLPDPMVTADLQRLAEDCTAAVDDEIDWGAIFGVNLVFNAGLDRPIGGRVCLARGGLDRCYGATWIWAATAEDQAQWVHEMGHAFGLPHSSLDAEATYDNVWDVMSESGACSVDPDYRSIAQEPIAYHKDLLGWIPAGRKFVAAPGSVTTIALGRLAQPGSDGYLLAEVPIPAGDSASDDSGSAGAGGRFYTVEARLRAGYDASLPGEAVVIHEVNPGRESPARPVTRGREGSGGEERPGDSGEMWPSGSVFRDPENGIAIAVGQGSEAGFAVTIATRPLPWPLRPRDRAIVPEGTISFTWQAVPGAAGYELEIAPAAAQGELASVVRRAAAAGISATLAPGSYRWRVRALSAQGVQPWTPSVELAAGGLEAGGEVGPALIDALPWGGGGDVYVATEPHGDTYAIWAAPVEGMTSIVGGELLGLRATHVYISSRAAGGLWEPPVRIDGDGGLCHSRPVAAIDGSGNAYALWITGGTPGTGADIYFAFRPYSAAAKAESGWSASIRVNDEPGAVAYVRPALAVDPQGNMHAAWMGIRSGRTALISAHLPAGEAEGSGSTPAWSPTMMVSGDGWIVFEPCAIVADSGGNVYLAWAQWHWKQSYKCPGTDIYFAGRTAGGTWSTASRITPNLTGRTVTGVGLLVDSRGVLYAAWREEHGSSYDLYAAACGPGCGLPGFGAPAWGEAAWLARREGSPAAAGVDIAADAWGSACAAWAGAPGQTNCLDLSPLARP